MFVLYCTVVKLCILLPWLPQANGGSSGFEWFEPTRINEKLASRPTSLHHPKLIRNYPVDILPIKVLFEHCFKEFNCIHKSFRVELALFVSVEYSTGAILFHLHDMAQLVRKQ